MLCPVSYILLCNYLLINPIKYNFTFWLDRVEPQPGPNEVKDSNSGVCHCGRKAKSKSERFCSPVTESNSHCPCVGSILPSQVQMPQLRQP